LPRGSGDDESLGAFVRRRLGAEALERVAQPLVAGIYTADPDELSLSATMPRFIEVERKERSLILGLRRALRKAPLPGTSGARWSLFVTFAGGMQELVTALAARLPTGAVVLKQRVSALERAGDHWRVATSEGNAFEADRVIVATESHATARLTRYLDPALATLLEEITYASAATVSLGYRRSDGPRARRPRADPGISRRHAERRRPPGRRRRAGRAGARRAAGRARRQRRAGA